VSAQTDNVDAARLLLDLGVSPNVENPENGETALHVAAWYDSARVAQLLIDRGVDVDHYDRVHGNTALGHAVWGLRAEAIAVLSRYGNDLWNLVLVGAVERVRESLAERPTRANAAWPDDGTTPLMRLPGDEDTAIQMIELFLAHGADPSRRNSEGDIAADIAERRGMFRAAALLRR
jgi:uncharacterized protein